MPRQLAPMTSTPASWQRARMLRESRAGTFSVTITMRLSASLWVTSSDTALHTPWGGM